MAFESVTDGEINELISQPKVLANPLVKARNIDGSDQINYEVETTGENPHKFYIYTRQNTRSGMEDSFSCGIRWVLKNGESLTLKRYNGPNHNHRNQIEKENIGYACHIHIATEKYIKANKPEEGFAEVTERYSTLAGAFKCLLEDCNVSGIDQSPDLSAQTALDL